MQAPRTTSVSSIAIAVALACAAATGSMAVLSPTAQAVTPQQGQQYGGQQHGGQPQYRVVAFEGKNAQQLQQLLAAESAGGWRLVQMSGNLVILQR